MKSYDIEGRRTYIEIMPDDKGMVRVNFYQRLTENGEKSDLLLKFLEFDVLTLAELKRLGRGICTACDILEEGR